MNTVLTYQEKCLVFWGPVLQRRHLCQILQDIKVERFNPSIAASVIKYF